MNKLNILVFPCGSETGLEIYRSLEFSRHIELFGANSIDDHGKFVYKNYFGNLPFIDDDNFFAELKKLVEHCHIDAIIPSMDFVAMKIKENEFFLKCKVISSPIETHKICVSKKVTYNLFHDIISVPKIYDEKEGHLPFPIFLKPDIGYGSRNTSIAYNNEELVFQLNKKRNLLCLEYLPGKEYTVDCFTDFNRNLLFVGPRERQRISNGISVSSKTINDNYKFKHIAETINKTLVFSGAWFYQVKERENGELVLLEIASRIAGSSATYRAKGVNLTLLSVFNAFNEKTEIIENSYDVTLDRALSQKAEIKLSFNKAYFDLDDTLILNEQVNHQLVSFIYSLINNKIKIILITKHEKDLNVTLTKYRFNELFDEIIHLKKTQEKSEYITGPAIFIDDSFSERKKVHFNTGVHVFSPDMVIYLKFK